MQFMFLELYFIYRIGCSVYIHKKTDKKRLDGVKMKNPWEEIKLTDYENHMKLESVMQLQTLNAMMKEQFYQNTAKTIMILGIAGGNGLEHINPKIIKKVFGIDINRDYLDECAKRYTQLDGVLQILCADLTKDNLTLPHANLVVANLFIEYVGYACFQKIINQVKPQYISCVIQINAEENFVSNSPYIHVFNHLNCVHHQMSKKSLIKAMEGINYRIILNTEELLPNGKKLVRLDFKQKI